MKISKLMMVGFLLTAFFFFAMGFKVNPVNAITTCYPSDVVFLTGPPADFPITTLIDHIESFEQLRTNYGIRFPCSSPVIFYDDKPNENAIKCRDGLGPIIIEFNTPVRVFGTMVSDFGDSVKNVTAEFEITFTDDTQHTCTFPDPNPNSTERMLRFFGVYSDKNIKRIVFRSLSTGDDGFRIYDLRIQGDNIYHWTDEGADTAWDNADNWDHNEPPSTVDAITVFDLPDTYTVTGYNGTISAMIIQNGVVTFDQGNVLELAASNSNSLEVNGGFLDFNNGSLVTKKAVIGNNEEGQMIMNPNTSWDANGITIGGNAKGELGVFGAVVNDNEINVGGNSEGYLRVIEGGELNVASDLAIGRYSAASIGFMWASGTGTQVTVSDFISIGMVGIGNFVVEDGGYVSAHNIGIGNSLQGYGSLFVKENSQVKTSYYINVNNNGSVLNKGKIDTVQITVSTGGLLVGTGEIDGFVNNLGGLIVGYSPGTLTIEGNYLQESEGFLEIEIGGMTPDSEHDLLHVTGNATLGGTLKLFFADGFAPQGGNPSSEDDTFDFIRVDGIINGAFSEVIVQGLEDGFQYDIIPEGGAVRLTALSNGVPVCIDEDGDGYPRYTISSCPNSNEADCNDTNPDINPGATEIPNAIDDDCDGNIDGFRATTTIPEECPPDYTDCGNGYCCPPETPVCGEGEDEGLCFEKGDCPVTEIYGQHSKEAEFLRDVRDSLLDSTPEGQELIKLYYQWSPAVVRVMEEDEVFKQEVKDMIEEVLPMLSH